MPFPPPRPVTAPAQPLPLRFRRPDGWPEPSPDWVAANQGWEPPARWVPVEGLAPAPAGWAWWRRDDVGWSAVSAAISARRRRGVIVDAVVFAVGAVLALILATLHLDIAFAFWGAVVFGPLSLARTLAGMRHADRATATLVRSRAAEVGQTLDRVAYADHVTAAGPGALPLEAFLARRRIEGWSRTGSWPADQEHDGVAERFRITDDPRLSRRHRAATVVFALVAGIVLVAIAADAYAASRAGSGATPAAFETPAAEHDGARPSR